jgi:hypothetical protein
MDNITVRFYSETLSRGADLGVEYRLWMDSRGGGGSAYAQPPERMSLCHVPFVLTPEAKSLILQVCTRLFTCFLLDHVSLPILYN